MLGLISACAGHPGTPPPSVPGGPIRTLALGKYSCELPGDATGPAGKTLKGYDFTVVGGSNYIARGMRGSYLYTGENIVMTGGAFKGLRFHRISEGFLREQTAGGKDGPMRCVLTTRTF